MKQKRDRIFGLVIAILMAIISGIFLFNVYRSQYLPTHYLLILVAVVVLLNLLIDWLLLSKGRVWKKTVAIILALLLGFGFIAGSAVIGDLNRFVDEVVKPVDQKDTYSILVRADDPLTDVDDVVNMRVGAVEGADYTQISALLPKNTGAPLQTYANYIGLAQNLLNQTERIILFNEAYRSIIVDLHFDFSQKTRVLASTDPELPNTSGTEDTLPGGDPSSTDEGQATLPTLPPEETQPAVSEPIQTFTPSIVTGNEPFLLYISGTDSAGSISTRGRSDVNIVMAVNPATHQVGLISIPRDSYVAIPDTGGYKDKLTHAGILGVTSSQNTIENLLGMSIPVYTKVNFSTLTGLVDQLGGVTVYNPTAFGEFAEGNIRLNGEQALRFSRTRYGLSGGDLARGANQLRVIQGIINEAIKPANLTRYNSILGSLANSFRTNLSSDAIAALVRGQLASGGSWNVTSYAMTGSGASGLYSYFMPNYSLSFIVLHRDSIAAAKGVLSGVIG